MKLNEFHFCKLLNTSWKANTLYPFKLPTGHQPSNCCHLLSRDLH
jgi:hypothetical protein